MAVFESESIYVETQPTLILKIQALEKIIDALLIMAIKAATSDNIKEYSLNDGQTIIKTVYKGVDGIMDSIGDLERVKTMYINRLNGRVMRAIDSKSITNGRT
jgi:hypothetical protein